MRTTLKMGRGRGAFAAGGPAEDPGGASDGGGRGPRASNLSPLSRYPGGRGPRGRWRMAGKIVFWLLVAALVTAGGIGAGVYMYFDSSVQKIQATDKDLQELAVADPADGEGGGDLSIPDPQRPTTALIIGYDKRLGVEKDVPPRSDTIMLVRADPQSKTLTLLSFPRDLVVEHPGCKTRGSWVGRINEAFTFCQSGGVLRTVKQLTGGKIDVNYVIKINFRGFRQVVDKVGGVYVDVDHRYFNDNSAGENFATINIQPGYQRLNGTQALDYARYRHGDSDFFRIARQQLFVRAFKQQVQGAVDPLKLIGVVNAITSNLQVVAGGGKKADADTILSYAKFLYDLPGGSFYQINLGGVTQDASFGLHVPESSVADAVEKFLNPDTEAATKATATATKSGATKVVGIRPADTTVAVLNGSTTEGAATLAAAELGKLGYQAESAGNAESTDFFDSQVLYDPAVKGGRVAAERLAALFDTEDVRPNAALETTLQVIVGQTFHSGLAPAAKDDTPESGKPNTTLDAAPALAELQPLQRKVSFPLLVPRFRETSSRLSSGGAEAVRTYKIKGKDAVKLVYQYGGQPVYWGIMQTAWTDAPILTGASVEREIKGRNYKLWFNGSKLHMIAFEENGAAYWVTNTLDDRFSNETMIAIAKGLTPLDAAA